MTANAPARLAGISLDCADPEALADFYLGLLGGRRLWSGRASVGIETEAAVLVMQRVEPYTVPTWPGTSIVHLDLTAVEHALALGAVQPEQPDPRWRVLLDPAGHPFCLTPITADRAC